MQMQRDPFDEQILSFPTSCCHSIYAGLRFEYSIEAATRLSHRTHPYKVAVCILSCRMTKICAKRQSETQIYEYVPNNGSYHDR